MSGREISKSKYQTFLLFLSLGSNSEKLLIIEQKTQMVSSVQTFQYFIQPSKHQSTSRDIMNCSHPLHHFLHTLF